MNRTLSRPTALALSLLLTISPTLAQQPAGGATPDTAASAPAAKTFSQQELDQLLAPIALYPDALLAQVLMASTYPLEVVEAARWSKANPKLTGKPLEEAMTKQKWDPSVKSLTSVPSVLQQMNDKLDWTQKLGDAFLAQQPDVMSTVQVLRAKADAAGNLKSSEQLTIKKETQGTQTIYIVESPKPEVIYVPTYNPSVVYGVWWYPVPPYYMYPPTYVYSPGLVFATGVVVGVAIWGGCSWGHGHGHSHVNININHYNSFNHTSVNNTTWNHNADHRRGVAYRDQNVARQYNRASDTKAVQSREQFRGRSDAGRAELKNMDKSGLNDGTRQADGTTRNAAASRKAGQQLNQGNDRASGLSGISNPAASREASARGSASRTASGQTKAAGGHATGKHGSAGRVRR